ncbi:MAG TPA: TRAP transporter large permease [Bacillota bacterium]|nr:TRAP transporter large permease [Bacillota bacterium]
MLFVVLFLINVPVSFVLGLVGCVGLIITQNVMPPTFAQIMTSSVDSFPLTAIPLFILAGTIMTESKMSEGLVNFSRIFLGRFKGGLLHMATGTAILFGAITGSATADAVAVGSMLSSSMLKEGYDRRFCTALVATAGCLGAVIPPSINLIVVGSLTGVSVWSLFIGSIIPGLLTGAGLMAISHVHALRAGYKALPPPSIKESLRITTVAIVPLMLPVIILGGIYSGKFTPTEAAAIAVSYAAIVYLIRSKFNMKEFYRCLLESTKVAAGPLLMVATAGLISYFMVIVKIPTTISSHLLGIGMSPFAILLIMNLIFFVIGVLMDTLPAMIILVPIFFKVAVGIGMDPIHFGVMISYNCSMAMATPPVGVALFASCSIFKTKVSEVMKPMLLLTLWILIMILVITYIPWLSLALV